MKRMTSIGCLALALLCAVCAGARAQEAPRLPCAVEGTGCQITYPAEWTEEELGAALAAFATPDGEGKLLVQLSRFPQWTYDELKAELIAASARNSVTDIEERVLDGRTWLTHRQTWDETQVFTAIAELGEGYFLSLEFRAFGGKTPEDVFGAEIDAVLLSLAPSDQDGGVQP